MPAVLGSMAFDKYVVGGIAMTIKKCHRVRYNYVESRSITVSKDYKRTKA